MFFRRDRSPTVDYTPGAALPGGEKWTARSSSTTKATKMAWAKRAADCPEPDHPLDRDREPGTGPAERVSKQDPGAGGRDLASAARRRSRSNLGRPQVHPSGHPGRAGEGEPGPGDARQVPDPPRPGLLATEPALEFRGAAGVPLRPLLAVLQRAAELVTRMGVEVRALHQSSSAPRGRLIEMQLEETMVGVAADQGRR